MYLHSLVLKEDEIKVTHDRVLLNSLIKACKYRRGAAGVQIHMPIQKQMLHQILNQVEKTIFGL